MRRATLIHWRPEEAAARLPLLRGAGWEAESFTPEGGNLKALREAPPHVFLIDLSRLPSHGREVGMALRRSPQTRHIPIIFAGGDPAKVARVRETLPDAIYGGWDQIESALLRAIRSAPEEPVVPRPMAGYAGTPLAKKLGIRKETRLTLLNMPQGFLARLPLPENVTASRRAAEAARVILFVRNRAELQRQFGKAAACVAPGGGLWIAWPKKSSGADSDLDGNFVRETGLASGWVDYKVCAIDETWSGFLFAPAKKPGR